MATKAPTAVAVTEPKRMVITMAEGEIISIDDVSREMLALVERQSSMRVVAIEQEIRELTSGSEALKDKALALEVKDQSSLDTMGAFVVDAKDKIAKVDKLTKPVRQFLHKLHSIACGLGNNSTVHLAQIVKTGDERMAAYTKAQRLEREAAERKSQEAQAAEEREKARRAQELIDQGRMKEAREVAAAPVVPIVPVVAPPPFVPSGLTPKEPWDGECFDIMATMKAIVDKKIPLNYVIQVQGKDEMKPLVVIDQSVLRYLAKQRQKDLNIPGCKAEQGISFARSRS